MRENQVNIILSKCKFIARAESWFVEGTECKLTHDVQIYKGEKISDLYAIFDGLTNETYEGCEEELPRLDGEFCSFEEFFIYNENSEEISELIINQN